MQNSNSGKNVEEEVVEKLPWRKVAGYWLIFMGTALVMGSNGANIISSFIAGIVTLILLFLLLSD